MITLILPFLLNVYVLDGVTAQDCPDIASSTLLEYARNHSVSTLTTRTGVPVTLDQTDTLDKFLLRDKYFLESMTHFAHERVPERVAFGRGCGAFGYFEVTHDISDICKSKVFNGIGSTTPVAVRFSSLQLRGGIDTSRDSRGFAVKFYTQDGNFDLVMFNHPVYYFNEPSLFPLIIHAVTPSPVNFIYDNNKKFDFFTSRPETFNFLLRLKTDEGLTDGYRHMSGFSVHTMQVSNSKNETHFVRFTMRPDAGKKYLTLEQSKNIAASDTAYFIRDLYNAVGNGSCPSWTLYVQVMTLDDCKNAGFDVFDLTQYLPEDKYPLRPVGKMVLNRNPLNYFAQIEQLAFSACNLVPGIQGAPDKMFAARCLAYDVTHTHRLGINFNKVKVNQPVVEANTFLRDGAPPVGDNDNHARSFPQPVENTDPPLIRITQKYPTYNLNQSVELYKTFDDGQKDRITTHIIDSLSYTFNSVQEKVLQRFAEISPEIVQRIEQRLGRRYTCDDC